MFFLNLASYSRLVILGTLGVYNILEILVVSLSYISLLPHVSDETRAAGFHVGVLEDAQGEESPEGLRDPGVRYQVPDALITTVPIGEKAGEGVPEEIWKGERFHPKNSQHRQHRFP